MAGFIRTVLGDIAPDQLGVTYMHEHLIIDSSIVARDFPHIHLPNELDAIAEVNLCKNVGVIERKSYLLWRSAPVKIECYYIFNCACINC